MKAIREGDHVKLKTGGVVMYAYRAKSEYVICKWHEGKKLRTDFFQQSDLIKVKSPNRIIYLVHKY